jgi:hypothetical protein
MNYVYGAIAGILWGALASFINSRITKWALKKETQNAVLIMNLMHFVIDVAALAAVFFLRKLLPFSFEAAIIATAAAMSMLNIVFAYKITGEK